MATKDSDQPVRKKYKISRYIYKSWAIKEWVCINKEKGEWRWKVIKYPGDLEQAIAGLIDLHLGPNFTVAFELTYPQSMVNEVRHQMPAVQLNVDVDDLRRLEKGIESSAKYILENIKDIIEV